MRWFADEFISYYEADLSRYFFVKRSRVSIEVGEDGVIARLPIVVRSKVVKGGS